MTEQKIIFLDIDGVMNGYSFWSLLGWNIAKKLHITNWYINHTRNPFGVHEEKVRRLSEIVESTNAKVVMSSSWRDYFWNVPYKEKHEDQKKLVDLFKKYDIEVIDITPHSEDGKRGKEILSWLEQHEKEVVISLFLMMRISYYKASKMMIDSFRLLLFQEEIR